MNLFNFIKTNVYKYSQRLKHSKWFVLDLETRRKLTKRSIKSINKCNSWLVIRRILRNCKRLIIEITKYWYIVIAVMGISIIIILLGLYFNVYTSWRRGLWDLRTFLMSSIVIVIFNNVIKSEADRHKKLIVQHSKYTNFIYEETKFINSLLSIFGFYCNIDPLLSSNRHNLFINSIDALKIGLSYSALTTPPNYIEIPEYYTREIYIKFLCKNNIEIIKNTKKYFEEKLLVNVSETTFLLGKCDEAIEKCNEILYTVDILDEGVFECIMLDWITSLSSISFLICAVMRRPWRAEKDYKIKREIDAILSTQKFTYEIFGDVNREISNRGFQYRIERLSMKRGVIKEMSNTISYDEEIVFRNFLASYFHNRYKLVIFFEGFEEYENTFSIDLFWYYSLIHDNKIEIGP